MNEAILKAKVLFGFGLLVAIFGMLYTPEIVKALVPFAICLFAASAALFTPELITQAKAHLKARSRVANQATPLFHAKQAGTAVRVAAATHVDYDQYFVPTYLRRQEVK